MDTAHASLLHQKVASGTSHEGMDLDSIRMRSSIHIDQEIEPTDHGYRLATVRSHAGGGTFVLIHHYVMPFHQLRASAFAGTLRKGMIEGHMWAPMDDHNAMDYNWICSFEEDIAEEAQRIEAHRGRGPNERGADFRKTRNKDNDWLIDRSIQRADTYTGIEGVNTQDHAIQESMGPITDRSQEHLGSSDQSIIAVRRMLIQAARMVKEGQQPPGVGTSYYGARPVGGVLAKGVSWRELVKETEVRAAP